MRWEELPTQPCEGRTFRSSGTLDAPGVTLRQAPHSGFWYFVAAGVRRSLSNTLSEEEAKRAVEQAVREAGGKADG